MTTTKLQALNSALVARSVTLNQYLLMRLLYDAQASGKTGMSPTALRDHLDITGAGTTGAIDKLETLGFVLRSAVPRDRRKFSVGLTGYGAEAVRAIVVCVDAVE